MFEDILVRPIFNILVTIYALIPGHNFGLALILFTILVRLAMWPLVKKQLHHAKAMRALQPELKRIKKESKGDKRAESMAVMALYKEREVSPFASIGYLILQLPIFIALYQGVRRIADDQQAIIDSSYGFVRDLPWMETLAADASRFDSSALGFGDLTRQALESGNVYWPAMLIVIASAAIQYYSSKQLMTTQGESKSLRALLKEQSEGKDVDQADVSAAVGRATIYFIPGLIFFISVGLVAALPFYWLVNGVIAYIQQKRVLDQDVVELEASVDDEEVVAEVTQPSKKTTTAKKASTKKTNTTKDAPKLNAKQKRDAQRSGRASSSKKPRRK